MSDDLPDDPVLLKQILLAERRAQHSQILDLKEQIKLLRDRLFDRKSEQTVDPQIPQLAPFNEAESVAVLVADNADEDPEEIVAPVKR